MQNVERRVGGKFCGNCPNTTTGNLRVISLIGSSLPGVTFETLRGSDDVRRIQTERVIYFGAHGLPFLSVEIVNNNQAASFHDHDVMQTAFEYATETCKEPAFEVTPDKGPIPVCGAIEKAYDEFMTINNQR